MEGSNNLTENDDSDIIENSPPNSPKKKIKFRKGISMMGLRKLRSVLTPLTNYDANVDIASPNSCQSDPEQRSIKAPPYSPLTPLIKFKKQMRSKQLISPALEKYGVGYASSYANTSENEPGESSIEAPPYSPLTPKPIYSCKRKQKPIILAPESPISSPFTHQELLQSPIIIGSETPYSSPAPRLSRRLLMMDIDSDDSVRDADYCPTISDFDEDRSSSVVSRQSLSILRNENETIELNSVERTRASNEHSRSNEKCTDEAEPRVETSNYLNAAVGNESSSTLVEVPGNKKLTRKRKRNEESWKQNIRKKLREDGNEYTDINGKTHRARVVQESCSCRHKCGRNFTSDQREAIHNAFWDLSDDEKKFFYGQAVQKEPKKQTTSKNPKRNKEFTFKYYLKNDDTDVQVCKIFFLKTLDISQRRINYFFAKVLDDKTGIPRPYVRGKHKKKFIPDYELQKVREHINLFPRVESHYCRKDTEKEYLEGTLTIRKMFALFKEAYPNAKKIKEHTYRRIFNTEFNISFQKPKKDRCDTCEEYKNAKKTPQVEAEYKIHMMKKEESRKARNEDRANKEDNIAVVCFDFENVFSLPRAEVSNFFYRRKLSSYNLTAHVNLNNKAYSAVWHEGITGRNANCIASALCKILERVILDLPNVEEIILWSDSCVPQNKNQVMTTALKYFLRDHVKIKKITQKYSEPGHGTIQEVDAIHSKIERYLQGREVFSHLGLIKLFIKLSKESAQAMDTIQMKRYDFYDFQCVSKQFSYSKVPYTKVKVSVITAVDVYRVFYSQNHAFQSLINVDISTRQNKKGKSCHVHFPDQVPLIKNFEEVAPKKKKI